MNILTGPNGLDFKTWCLLNNEGTSNKFWRAFLADKPDGGTRVATWWGRIGTAGSTQVKDFPSRGVATDWVLSKQAEKERGGYHADARALAETVTAAIGERTLAITPAGPPRTANLLEVCETSVQTAVDALTGAGRNRALSADDVESIRKARAAMAELETRYHELTGLIETVDLLYSAKAS